MKEMQHHAARVLDQLRELDQAMTVAYYDMGRLLSALEHGRLYDAIGYDSLGHLIDKELSFARATGYTYLRTYRHLRRLHYSKTEALQLFRDHSFSRVCDILPSMKDKVGTRAVGRRIEDLDYRQINFTLTKAEYTEAIRALKNMGAEVHDGRLQHSSEAFITLIRRMRRRKAA